MKMAKKVGNWAKVFLREWLPNVVDPQKMAGGTEERPKTKPFQVMASQSLVSILLVD